MRLNKLFIFFIVVLLSACGGEGNTNGIPEKERTTESLAPSENAAKLLPTIETTEENNSVMVNYKVKNVSGVPQKLTFATGLQADYIVYDEKGKKVTQYSEESMSTQAINVYIIQKDQELQNSFPIYDLPNGRYKVEVFLTAKEEQARVETDLIIENSLYTKASGILVGQMDPHTIEVDMKGEMIAFQLTEEAIGQLPSLKEGSEVSFVYTDNEIQKTIEKFILENE